MKPLETLAVPPGFVTATVLVPDVPAGVTAVSVVELTTVTDVAAEPPMVTAVVPVKLVPLMVMAVPPAVGPRLGVTDESVGALK